VWELYRQCAGSGATVWLEGTGEETRDYLHVEEVSSALLRLAEARLSHETSDAGGGCLTVNVASGAGVSALELARQVRDLVAPAKEIRCRGAARRGDPRAWQADTSRLRSLAPGWQPRPLAESLAACVAEWRADETIQSSREARDAGSN
jgi:UDP-glucose 4-epimerase